MKLSVILFIFVITVVLFLYGCTTPNINKLNSPSNISTKLKTNKELKRLSDNGWSDEIINRQLIEDSEYKLKRRLSARERIIDSLNIPLERLMIVDYFSHGTSGEFEMNYFIYDSIFIRRNFNLARTPMENISSGEIKDIKKNNPAEGEMLSSIYEKFYMGYPSIPKKIEEENDGGRYSGYEITLLKNNKVNFYKFSNFEGFIVYQLKGRRFVPL